MATATPWFPVETVPTPFCISNSESCEIVLRAPRILKLLPSCWLSSLKKYLWSSSLR